MLQFQILLVVAIYLGLTHSQEGIFGLQSAEEAQYPKLHKCIDLGEAYSAAYLTTKLHLLEMNIERNLSRVSCEMASTVMLSTAKRSKKAKLKAFRENANAEGLAIQSLDVLDYSVLHLSAYERSHRKFAKRLGLDFDKSDIKPIKKMAAYFKKKNSESVESSYLPEALRTVVVMPFLGTSMGAGHSNLDNRYEYIKACFWSLYEFFPHIVVGVISGADLAWAYTSGLPFYDVILVEGPKDAALPLATLMEVKRRLEVFSPRGINFGAKSSKEKKETEDTRKSGMNEFTQYYNGYPLEHAGQRDKNGHGPRWDAIYELESRTSEMLKKVARDGNNDLILRQWEISMGPEFDEKAYDSRRTRRQLAEASQTAGPAGPTTWDFDYIFWTESDQVVLLRILRELYSHLKLYPRRMLLPHRLMPYPDYIIDYHKREPLLHIGEIDKETDESLFYEEWKKDSCCLPRQNCIERGTWQHVTNTSVPITKIYGVPVPLGNSHFRIETYRGCTLRQGADHEDICP